MLMYNEDDINDPSHSDSVLVVAPALSVDLGYLQQWTSKTINVAQELGNVPPAQSPRSIYTTRERKRDKSQQRKMDEEREMDHLDGIYLPVHELVLDCRAFNAFTGYVGGVAGVVDVTVTWNKVNNSFGEE